MSVEEQVVVVYCGVRGFLDKIDPSKIGEFEKQFLGHMRTSGKPILDSIAKEQKILKETEDKLKATIKSFIEGFSSAATSSPPAIAKSTS